MIEIEEALAFLPPEREPPARLEESTVALLRREGEILGARLEATVSPSVATKGVERRMSMEILKSPSRFPGWAAVLGGIAAIAIAFFAGFRVGEPPQARKDVLPRFALLLYEGKSFDRGRPGEHLREYSQWARSLAKRGIPVEGDELSTDFKVLRASGGSIRVEAPPPADEVLAGYFVIGASDLGRALEIARECPHLKYGGRVEVRPIPGR